MNILTTHPTVEKNSLMSPVYTCITDTYLVKRLGHLTSIYSCPDIIKLSLYKLYL